MDYFCTICCKEKRTDPGQLPARERYLSARIEFVLKRGKEEGRNVLILSGKYGLIGPDDPIDWYDKILLDDDVSVFVPLVQSQLFKWRASSIHFFCLPRMTTGWSPYYDALEESTSKLGISITYVIMDSSKYS